MIAESVDYRATSDKSRCTWVEHAKDPADEILKIRRQSTQLRISGLACAAAFAGSLITYYDGHTQDKWLYLTAAVAAAPALLLYGFGVGSRDCADILEAPKGTSDLISRRELLGPVTNIHFAEFLPEGHNQPVGDVAPELSIENGPISPILIPGREYLPIPLADAGYYRVKNGTRVNEDYPDISYYLH